MKLIYNTIEGVGVKITLWVGIISAVIAGIGWFSNLINMGAKVPFTLIFTYLQNQYQFFWLLALTMLGLLILYRLNRLNKKFIGGFSDNFKGRLEDNWDFLGSWRIVDNDKLMVTGSDEGGITKVGTHWENYEFVFKAKIINKCLGVIVRAQDLNNYYMFQIRHDKIRPHRRILVPTFENDKTKNDDSKQSVTLLKVTPYWQTESNTPEFQSVSISPNLDDWFDVKIIVEGQSVKIYIYENLIFDRPSLLLIPTGKVGFRNAWTEEAYIKDVKVKLLS